MVCAETVFEKLRDAALSGKKITRFIITAEELHDLHFKHERPGITTLRRLVEREALNPAVLKSALKQAEIEDPGINKELTRKIVLALSHTPLQRNELEKITHKTTYKITSCLLALRDVGVITTINERNMISYGYLNLERVRDEAKPFVKAVQDKWNAESAVSNAERTLLSGASFVGVARTGRKAAQP